MAFGRDTGGEIGGEFVLFRKGVAGALDDIIKEKRAEMERLQKLSEAEKKAEAKRKAAETSQVDEVVQQEAVAEADEPSSE